MKRPILHYHIAMFYNADPAPGENSTGTSLRSMSKAIKSHLKSSQDAARERDV